jgi:hypothetical protein
MKQKSHNAWLTLGVLKPVPKARQGQTAVQPVRGRNPTGVSPPKSSVESAAQAEVQREPVRRPSAPFRRPNRR